MIKALLLAAVMGISAAAAYKLTPDQLLADTKPPIDLESAIPASFGDWITDPQSNVVVIDPVTAQKLASIYTSTLTRTYLNKVTGERMMLSLAYVRRHSDDGSVHYPDVCYPAQGFSISKQHDSKLDINGGSITVRRMLATAGGRIEPVTFWVVIGDEVITGGPRAKLAQLRYGFEGYIADGMLFRVSSISNNPEESWGSHKEFIRSMMSAIPASTKTRFIGKA